MILPRYFTAVACVDRDPVVSFLVRRHLGLDRHRPMLYALSARNLGQADLVLALLRIGTRPAMALVERVVGRPVRLCPCVWLRWPVNGRPRTRLLPRFRLAVSNNPRRPNTPAHARFEVAVRDGFTIEQMRLRGATRRDVRRALREGWIREAA